MLKKGRRKMEFRCFIDDAKVEFIGFMYKLMVKYFCIVPFKFVFLHPIDHFMQNSNQNHLFIGRHWGLFVGQFSDAKVHRHYALQISIGTAETFQLTDQCNTEKSYSHCFINSNVPHQLVSERSCCIILINPLSSLGHHLRSLYHEVEISTLNKDLEALMMPCKNFSQNGCSFEALVQEIQTCFEQFSCDCEQNNHYSDDRIGKAIQFLETNCDRIVSLKEISDYSFLSETRFLHLFKEKTGLNFRRYQLWNKLIASLPYLKKQSITETAHQFGFTDSSHFNRTFKETFGLNPKFLLSLQ
ncbi:MAG: hypothetical protein BGO40_05125 [Chryseobacterium sp. 39-10]|nr:MAG: hypothetical protein BGO40_05125 [Chryseobacterium sp. 39-10]